MFTFNKKKRFFKQKIYSVQAAIWEVEFKISKSRMVREGVRLDRDRAKEALNQMEAAINAAKTDEEKKNIEAQKAQMQENVIRYEKQMKMVDDQINGAAGDDTHEPVVGLIEQLKSYIELKLMYEQHLETI